MAKFRKKPVEVEAHQWHPGFEHVGVERDEVGYYVTTMHDQRVYLADGDWIIAEPVPNRYYPCKPDVFAKTYDRA